MCKYPASLSRGALGSGGGGGAAVIYPHPALQSPSLSGHQFPGRDVLALMLVKSSMVSGGLGGFSEILEETAGVVFSLES